MRSRNTDGWSDANAGNNSVVQSDIPAVCSGRGDIHVVEQDSAQHPSFQLMPTTSCAIAATRVWAADTTLCRFLCASSYARTARTSDGVVSSLIADTASETLSASYSLIGSSSASSTPAAL